MRDEFPLAVRVALLEGDVWRLFRITALLTGAAVLVTILLRDVYHRPPLFVQRVEPPAPRPPARAARGR